MNEGTCGVFDIFSQLYSTGEHCEKGQKLPTKVELFYLERFSWFITLDIC